MEGVPQPVWVLAAAALIGAALKLAFDFVVKVLAVAKRKDPAQVDPATMQSDAWEQLSRDLKSIAKKLDRLHTDLQVLVTQGGNRDARIGELARDLEAIESRVRKLEQQVAALEVPRRG